MGLVAAAMLAGAASAAKPECTSGTALTVSTVDKPVCVKNTGSATVKLTVTPMDAEKKLKVVVWNSARTASWGTSAPTFDGTAMSAQGGAAKVSASQTSTSFFVTDLSANLCGGVHDIASTESGEWSVMVLRDYTVMPGMVAPTKSVSFEVLASEAGASDIAMGVDAPFAKLGYMVQGAVVTTDYAATVKVRTNTGPNDVSGTKANMVTTFTEIESVNAGQVQLLVKPDTIAATEYDWKTNGPFITVKVTLTSVTEFDALPTSWTAAKIPASGSPKVYMATMPQFWRAFSLQWSLSADGTGAGTAASQHIRISFTAKTIAAITGSTLEISNGEFSYAATDVRHVFNLKLLSSANKKDSGRFFIKLEKSATCKATISDDTIFLKGMVEKLTGECPTGYSSCHKKEADHPSSKAATSANGMSNRMRQCLLVPSVENPMIASTKCIECTSDCDCGGGQYCHLDPGVCRRTDGTYYNCDTDSNRQLGLCVAKDPTGDILGQPCRTDVGQALDNGARLPKANAPYHQLLVAESVQEAEDAESLISASSFCGGVRFYNASAPGSVTASQTDTDKANAARAILWRGSCVNHMCTECDSGNTRCGNNNNNPGTTQSNGVTGSPTGVSGSAQRCINGLWMENLIVDGTQRTFGLNTVAGTMLAAVFMLIGLQGCTCLRLYQEYKRDHPVVANPAITKAAA